MTTATRDRPAAFIPPADKIRSKLYRARMEAKLLARLLKLAERRAKMFPPTSDR